MKKILTNYRYYVLFVFGLITLLGIFATPLDELPDGQWWYTLISSKAIGFGAGYVWVKLTKRWEKQGTIPELTDFTENY